MGCVVTLASAWTEDVDIEESQNSAVDFSRDKRSQDNVDLIQKREAVKKGPSKKRPCQKICKKKPNGRGCKICKIKKRPNKKRLCRKICKKRPKGKLCKICKKRRHERDVSNVHKKKRPSKKRPCLKICKKKPRGIKCKICKIRHCKKICKNKPKGLLCRRCKKRRHERDVRK